MCVCEDDSGQMNFWCAPGVPRNLILGPGDLVPEVFAPRYTVEKPIGLQDLSRDFLSHVVTIVTCGHNCHM